MDWDLTDIRPWRTPADAEVHRQQLACALQDAAQAFPDDPGCLNPARAAALFGKLEACHRDLDHAQSYLICALAAGDAAAQAELAELGTLNARLDELMQAALALIDELAPGAMARLLQAPELRDFSGYIRGAPRPAAGGSALTVEPEIRDLAGPAWSRLYQRLSAPLTIRARTTTQAAPAELPIARRRECYGSPDKQVRDEAFAAVGAAWRSIRIPAAASLNALARYRIRLGGGADAILARALQANQLRPEILESLEQATRSACAELQCYLRVKAQRLGRAALGMQDLVINPWAAGMASNPEDAADTVIGAFEATHPPLARSARQTVESGWLRLQAGGSPCGDFCAPFPKAGQWRVLVGHHGQLQDLNTLAHELGHAHHAASLGPLNFWRQQLPTAAAETASTVAEGLFRRGLAALRRDDAQQMAALTALNLDKAVTYLCLVPGQFAFERSLYAQRQDGELEPDALDRLMCEAQRQVFGAAMDPDALEPFAWVSNPFLYDSARSFHNFPYTLGFLLSQLIVSRLAEPDFGPDYELFLQHSGSMDLETLCRDRLAIDLAAPDVWTPVIDDLGEQIRALESVQGDGTD